MSEFNLSDKIFELENRDMIPAFHVKEFIKRLKLSGKFYLSQIKFINKISGEKLI